MLTLAAEMNAFTKFVAMPMRGHGNVTGADVIMRWHDGLSRSASICRRGYPRFNPGEFSTVDLLVRGDCDAAFIIGADPGATMPQPAIDHLARIPTIVLDPQSHAHEPPGPRPHHHGRAPASAPRARSTAWTRFPLPLRPALKSPYPTDEEVIRRIHEAVAAKPAWVPTPQARLMTA